MRMPLHNDNDVLHALTYYRANILALNGNNTICDVTQMLEEMDAKLMKLQDDLEHETQQNGLFQPEVAK